MKEKYNISLILNNYQQFRLLPNNTSSLLISILLMFNELRLVTIFQRHTQILS
jgi:hypothetical protein